MEATLLTRDDSVLPTGGAQLVQPAHGKSKSDPMATKSPARPAVADSVRVVIDLTATEAAWKKHEPRVRALDARFVNPARIDVTLAAAIALAGVNNVLARREALVEAFRDPPLAQLDGLPELCLAAQHADLLHRVAEDPTAPFVDLLPRITELRGLLLDEIGRAHV